ncbi:RNA polymerase sigma factor [Streptomyces clavuligerus]|uniref:RNA polymerase ECF-subfamily sigma factor n=1 Tax=Streptomyces clavuligerus TaxID=1901 RepID=E2Q2Y2_STRCL|nr:RNA polymerase subunit sigma-24 [Streptomyces clavuligerus]AXU16644.1 RNA polymerase sigma factor [Streptomyces clavuligerus]EFG06735.1 RNA polymerase ECF-subfamily sigma factor [Streptomyces clavuligerus]MBY6304996.1 RNA polymerase sigma factor [Streptomyces clavuligerus]QCS07721.1 RNA polymerase sigma factor [Streptomyces clavuligerus]
MDEKPDDELLAAMAESDRDAFEALYRRYAPWLRARLGYRCADITQLDDAVQEAFLSVWRICARGHPPEVRDCAGWLWRIAERRLIDAARTHRSQGRLHQLLAGLRRPGVPSAEEQALEAGEFSGAHTALRRLPEELRAVVQATVIDGLTTRQAADRLGLPVGTVKTRAMRARGRLREELAHGEGTGQVPESGIAPGGRRRESGDRLRRGFRPGPAKRTSGERET